MARGDWFERSSWTPEDELDFHTRLKRCRSDSTKAQCLRIQALYLAVAGHHDAALKLLDQLFTQCPVRFEMAQAHLQRAGSLASLDRIGEAIAAFRAALAAEDAYPNVRTNAALDFAWLIANRRLDELYDEAEHLLRRYERENRCSYPFQRFGCATIRAFIAAEQGRSADARAFANQAYSAAAETHSGLRYHPRLGLVGQVPEEVGDRLSAISRLA